MQNITGKRYGRLVAEYPTEKRDRKGSIFWHCRCDCGRETDVTEDGLVHGNYRSCGCLKSELQSNINKQLHLVDGTCVEWLEKRKHRSDNTSGLRGVSRMKNGHYRVSIGFKGQRYHLGTYASFQDAAAARLEAEEQIHGGFVAAYRRWQERAKEDLDWAQRTPFSFKIKKEGGQFQITTNAGQAQQRDGRDSR